MKEMDPSQPDDIATWFRKKLVVYYIVCAVQPGIYLLQVAHGLSQAARIIPSGDYIDRNSISIFTGTALLSLGVVVWGMYLFVTGIRLRFSAPTLIFAIAVASLPALYFLVIRVLFSDTELNRDPPVLRDAIRIYHDLLTDNLAAETAGMLEEQQRRRHLAFGENPLCTSLRPRFLEPDQYRFLQTRVPILLSALNRCHEAALADATFRRQFHLTEQEESLLPYDPGFASPMPTSRLDAFFGPDTELRFTEYNAETPAGTVYSDGLAQLFYATPVMGQFLKRYRVIPLPNAIPVMHALLDAFHQWCGRREQPRIAILDWKEVPTYSEFVLFQNLFQSNGLSCIIADPREVEYRDGKLMAGDYHINLIYKRVLISELLERGGIDHPVVQAVRNGAVCMANPFRCKILHKKACLAVLTDERNSHLFTTRQRQAIFDHIPWTRIVEERHTTFAGAPVDLVPFILRNRDLLVLKPNDDYGGKGIVLGWLVDDGRWEEAVRTALKIPYIVQQRITLPKEPFPSMVAGQVRITDRMYDTAPFIVNGDYVDGCLTRIATDPLLNVTAGGGSTVPTFVIEPR